jgi:hypothetical protein
VAKTLKDAWEHGEIHSVEEWKQRLQMDEFNNNRAKQRVTPQMMGGANRRMQELQMKKEYVDALAIQQKPFTAYPFRPHISPAPPRVRRKGEVTDKLLEEGVYAMPLSGARDLWIVKFGDGWVRIPDWAKEEEDYLLLYTRLLSAGLFEQLNAVREGSWQQDCYVRIKE